MRALYRISGKEKYNFKVFAATLYFSWRRKFLLLQNHHFYKQIRFLHINPRHTLHMSVLIIPVKLLSLEIALRWRSQPWNNIIYGGFGPWGSLLWASWMGTMGMGHRKCGRLLSSCRFCTIYPDIVRFCMFYYYCVPADCNVVLRYLEQRCSIVFHLSKHKP